MVQVRKSFPQKDDGSLNVEAWLDHLVGFSSSADRERMGIAVKMAMRAESSKPAAINGRIGCFTSGLEMASILNELHLDEDTLIASLVYRAVREQRLSIDIVKDTLGTEVESLVAGVLKMAAISELRNDQTLVLGQTEAQVENIRKMLVAMVDDVRVGLIKLAERTQAIRSVKYQEKEKQERVSREVFYIYAPLAHRLGIGQIKWELEDLSFRYLQPDAYKNIASLLDEKRIDRQVYIDNIINKVEENLKAANIVAEVDGRVKHIYSIWRKMQRKGVSFDEVYDIRALRILVREIKDCYSSLGVVHTLWRNIPKEFDDYIANPKSNGYRSLHTAVIGPDAKVLEVQIRTNDMHEEAELGVCAHWLYKGTDVDGKSRSYEQKIEWLRQVLEWHDETGGSIDISELADELSQGIEKDRIYVFTPLGDVVDLVFGATPVDFAYHIHTEVGHKCRGAKVDGRIVPLNTALSDGQKIEIITGNEVAPNRDWLRSSLGFVNSARARSKVRAWFKKQARDKNVVLGRALLDRELKRMALTSVDYKILAQNFRFDAVDDLHAALGAGDISSLALVRAAESLFGRVEHAQTQLFSIKPQKQNTTKELINVAGVGNLLTVIAKCCKPLPGDEIVGYVTLNRGVSIHRKDCTEMLQSGASQPERVIEVSWGKEESYRYPVDIALEAYDRTGLLGDITGLLSAMRVNVLNINTHTDKSTSTAHMKLTIEISEIEQLLRLLGRLNNMPNITSAVRVS